MKRFFWVMLTLIAMMTVALPGWAGGRRGGMGLTPRLLEPTENANLTGKTELLFRWGSEGDRSLIQEYQFKLYKGTKTIEEGLIKAVTVPANTDHLTLPVELFENGGTYSWQLRGSGVGKTRSAYSIFKVTK